MVAQRAAGHWRLLSAVAVGAVFCSALMSAVILYSDAVRDLGLKHALATAPRFTNDVRVTSSVQLLNPRDYEATRAATDDLIALQLGGVVEGEVRVTRSATFFPTAPGAVVTTDPLRPRANFWVLDDLMEAATLVEGRLPITSAAATGDQPPGIELLMFRDAADAYGLQVGSEFDLHPFWRAATPLRGVITGLIDPVDPDARYWMGSIDRYRSPATSWPTYAFFIDEATLVRSIGGYLPDMDGTLETLVFVDVARVNSGNADAVREQVAGFRNAAGLRLATTQVTTSLDSTIATYQEKLFFTRLPLFALMIQVTGIVLFYLVMVSTMVIERQMGEIALLRSRGAGTAQVMLAYVIEGLGVVFAAIVLGPLLAAAAIALLGLTPAFSALSDGDLMQVRFSFPAFLMASLGAALALFALLWPAYRACRLSMTHYKQQISRPPAQPIFFRYYLDLVLIAGAAVAFYRLRQRGSFVTDNLFGGLSADPILLATPSLFMLMVALIFLRLFPLGLKLVLFATSRLDGATAPLALTRMARSPLQHSRLILLLILATAVGMFAAGFRATLDRGYQDRAAYLAGSEARLTDFRAPLNVPTGTFLPAVVEATGSSEISPAVRMSGSFSVERFRSVPVTVLGVDRETFAGQAFWRGDFGESPPRLLEALEQEPAPGLPSPIGIPADSRFAGAWVQLPLPGNVLRLGLRLRDRDNSVWEYRLQPEDGVEPGEWQFVAVDLARPTNVRPSVVAADAGERGWVLDGFFVQLSGPTPGVAQHHTVVLDDFQVSSSEPATGWGSSGFADGVVLDGFEAVEHYEILAGATLDGDPGALSRGAAPNGRTGSVAQLSFIRGRGGSPTVAFRVAGDSRPLPIIADQRFLEDQALRIGDEFPLQVNSQRITVRVVGSFDLFPTFDPANPGGFAVADLQALQAAATRIPGVGVGVYANEAWIGSYPGSALTQAGLFERGLNVQQVYDRRGILAEQSSDPLIAASWEGILFLSFAAVLIVSTLGFVVYSGISAIGRSLEFAILRTMGLGGRQILGVVTFEQAFVVVAGIAAGTLLGFPLSRLMISYMGLTERGADPLPPLVSVISWQAVLTVYALLGLVVSITVVVLVSLYSRLAVSRALRMGEL